MGKTIERKWLPAEVKSYDDSSMTITHFISTEDVDRSGDVMRADGMRIDGMPAVLKNHGMDEDTKGEPIARCVNVEVSTTEKGKKGILVTTQYFDGSGLTPPDNTGQRLYQKARDEYMPWWSVGFITEKAVPRRGGGREVLQWNCVEYSQVGVPDNINAKAFNPETDEHAFDLKFSVEVPKEDEGEEEPQQAREDEANQEPNDETDGGAAATDEGENEEEPEEAKSFLHGLTPVPVPPEYLQSLGILEVTGCGSVDIEDYKALPFYATGGTDGVVFVKPEEKDGVVAAIEQHMAVGLKAVTTRVATRLPQDAMYTIFYAFLDELWLSAKSDKDARGAVKEMGKLMEPYAVDFVVSLQEMEAEQKKARYADHKAHRGAAADSAPAEDDETPDNEPPVEVKGLQVVMPAAATPAQPQVRVSISDIKQAVTDVVGEKVAAEVRRMTGKLD